MTGLTEPLVDWFAANARDLPWRHPGTPAWSVLVSEVMLQQTPVSRVLPAFAAWLERWPTPAALAAAPAGEAVRMWGKLGYPGRALRLHACAVAVTTEHGGRVPDDLDALLALPGVGAYTARAVLAFAYGRRAAVVDTNVRRVLARAVSGDGQAGPPSTARDLALMETVLPVDDAAAARFCAAAMELGAVVCTGRCTGLPAVPDQRPVCLAAGRLAALRRPGRASAAVRRHRPSGARAAAGRAAGSGGPGGAAGPGCGVAAGRATRPRARRAGQPTG